VIEGRRNGPEAFGHLERRRIKPDEYGKSEAEFKGSRNRATTSRAKQAMTPQQAR
jgi:hypothetical protein